MSNMFDFHEANRLIESVEKAARDFDTQNGQMEARFTRLRDFFADDGYEEFVPDMKKANVAIADVIRQMHKVSQAIGDYAERLREST